jgi:uncharacterized protein
MESKNIQIAPLRRLALLLLACTAAGCSNGSLVEDEASASTIEALSHVADGCESDYSEEELTALAESPEVQANLFPYAGSAPPPDRSLHVAMSDGVRIAVDLYFPPDFDAERSNAPTVYTETWYRRAQETEGMALELYRAAGFVVAIADPRGFAASFGSQSGYLTDAQRQDQREMIGWLGAQPWSNGQVAAVGISVSAMLAEALLASGAPELEAGIVRATEWDQYNENLFPGGVPNPSMHALISEVLSVHRAEPCLADPAACADYALGPVAGDEDLTLLRQALSDHADNLSPQSLEGVMYSDDVVGSVSFDDVSPLGHASELAEHAVPARITASWMDGATAQGALARYAALPSVPMQLSIGATTHLGGLDADPYTPDAFAPARVAPDAQFGADVEFLKRTLSGERIARRIDYAVLGSDTWKTTDVWPPRAVRDHTLYLSRSGLSARSARKAGERTYQVDPDTSSAAGRNRWSSQRNAPVYYGDRRFVPGQRAEFDGHAFHSDVELVGAPELCIAMRSDQPDGVVFAYLEDVAPDGRVTYLTEGFLRLHHRKTRSGGCDPARGTERSFARRDGSDVLPGELMQIEIPFLPVAARIRAGHRLRLALAGADAGTFPMLSDAPSTWSIAYGGTQGSSLSLPLKRWSNAD